MNWLDKLLGRKEPPPVATSAPAPEASAPATDPLADLQGISIGRYSDNNKTLEQLRRKRSAERSFKDKQYTEAIASMLYYLRDEAADNVRFTQDGDHFQFTILQGSRQVTGSSDGQSIIARADLAVMQQPATAVMRRLLELNFGLLYAYCAIDEDQKICMLFRTAVSSASPDKLYAGLRELAIRADRLDDNLMADFSALQPLTAAPMLPLQEAELQVKYKALQRWITETSTRISQLNQDAFAGAVAYLLLDLVYRIDFLIVPEGKLLTELEKINALYWTKKDELPLVSRNRIMKEQLDKLAAMSPETFKESVYHSTASFSTSAPLPADKMKDKVYNANKDAQFYIDHKYDDIAIAIVEYGLLACQFAYSIPRVQTELITVFMAVVHADYTAELGMHTRLYDPTDSSFHKEGIADAVDAAIRRNTEKYVNLYWDHSRTSYDSLYDFCVSFSDQVANLNLELKKITV